MVGGLGVAAYTWRVEPHWLEVIRRPLPIENLPGGLEGTTLAQISDLHVGPRVDSEYLIEVLGRIRALQPDIVAFTGDFVSYTGPELLDELSRVLSHWSRGRLGTFAVLGNHDYGWGWKILEVAAAITERAEGAGITVLRNQTVDVAGLQVVGLEDYWGPRFGPEPVLRTLDPERGALALCHNPDAADRPVWGDFRGWILSGHTHGGQCKPPFLPPPILPVVNKRYTEGAFELEGGRHMYISRGVGHLLRVRFNVRPEVTVFTLTRA